MDGAIVQHARVVVANPRCSARIRSVSEVPGKILIFDRTDSGIRERAQELMRSLIADAAAAGYGEYRTHLDFMDQVAATYSWNDGALARVQAQIKDALDPNGILSPGKNGIWPRHLREGRKT